MRGLRNEALVPGVESRSFFYDLGIGTRWIRLVSSTLGL